MLCAPCVQQDFVPTGIPPALLNIQLSVLRRGPTAAWQLYTDWYHCFNVKVCRLGSTRSDDVQFKAGNFLSLK